MMKKYISILRGINVSGQKKILMNDLKALYEELNFKNISTYVQSGNVIFNCDKTKPTVIEKRIEQKISEQYNFNVPVIIRTADEMETVINNNPFIRKKSIDVTKLHVTFLSEQPTDTNLEKINALNYLPDEFIISGKEIYLHIPVSYGNTKLSNNFFENKLKVTATTRNWKTVNELVRLGMEK